MKFPSVIALLLCTVFSAFSQDTMSVTRETTKTNPVILNHGSTPGKTKSVSYVNEFSMGVKLATSGWSLFADYTKDVNLDKKRTYYFELEFLKHPKETKRVNEFTIGNDSPKPFVYGKQNTFFNLKLALGEKLMIGEKADKSGFQVMFNYAGGITAGLVKPYYLDVYNDDEEGGVTKSIKYSDETESLFLDATSIYGASGFSIGFNEISFVPGIFAKAGMNFDWATYDDFVKSVETGIGVEVYAKQIPLMIIENNKPYFIYLYLSLQLGKKW